MKVPVAEPWIDKDEVESVLKAIKSGWVAKGKELIQFEEGFASYFGAKYAITASSGTAALELALRALDLKGKEIITSAASCVATVNAILHAGYKPVFVDIELTTYNMDTRKIEERLSPQTGAIVPVHLYGHPCDMDPILDVARKAGIPVVEDCGQSMGAKYKGLFAGAMGKAGCFSLYANKTITTGEGGIVITDDQDVAYRARIIRNQGQHPDKPFYHIMYGYNFKMSNIQAAIGLAQLKKLDRILQRRRKNAARLRDLLQGIPEIQLPQEMHWAGHCYFCFPIFFKSSTIDAETFCAILAERGVETRFMFGPMSEQPYYVEMFGRDDNYPMASEANRNGFYVSCSPTLKPAQLEYMASAIKAALGYEDMR